MGRRTIEEVPAVTEDAKQAWTEVGERFTALGKGVAARYHEQPARTRDEEEKDLERAAKEVVDELGRGVNAIAETIKDENARKGFQEAIRAVGDAITASVQEVAEGVRSSKRPPSEPPPPPPAD
jgi:DNA-binding ferritin-like protein